MTILVTVEHTRNGQERNIYNLQRVLTGRLRKPLFSNSDLNRNKLNLAPTLQKTAARANVSLPMESISMTLSDL